MRLLISSFCRQRLIFKYVHKIVYNRSYLTVMAENLKIALTKGETFCMLLAL